ncbi:MAG TPA: hypothetical protein VF713_26130 [Thermoanaerobaculia bacterium]
MNFEEPRRPVLGIAAVASALTTASLLYVVWVTGRGTIVVVPFFVISAALLLAWLVPGRFWWATRLVALIIGAAYLGYIVDQFFFSPQPFSLLVERSRAAPFNAILGFLFFGVPCFLYAIFGSTSGRGPYVEGQQVTSIDRSAFYIAVVARWLFVALTSLAGFVALLRLLR